LNKRFILRRGIIRKLIGLYTGEDPTKLEFTYNKYGKPMLKNSFFDFSTSNSHGYAVFSLSLQGPLGIDMKNKGL
jgi:4'-phosphopantetheinyl transferase